MVHLQSSTYTCQYVTTHPYVIVQIIKIRKTFACSHQIVLSLPTTHVLQSEFQFTQVGGTNWYILGQAILPQTNKTVRDTNPSPVQDSALQL